MSDTDLQTAPRPPRPEDHRRGARPQDGRPLDPRGGARPLLRGRRGRLDPDPAEAPPQSRDRRDPADTPEGRARSAQILNSANFIARLRREARYQQIVASGQYRGPLIAAEGDSWFQYPFRLKDVIDWGFETYAIYCRSEAGDTLENMVRRAEYLDALERTGGRVLLLSGGGNDLVAGGNLAQHLRPFDPQPAAGAVPARAPSAASSTAPSPASRRSCAPSGRAFPSCRVICHGYDYTIPNDGNWLGKPMATRGIADRGLQKAIAHEMVDRLNTRLINLANQTPRIAFVDVRGTVGDGRWFDELHPTNEGYGLVTKKIVARVAELTAGTRGAPATAEAPSTADTLRARRRAKSPTPPAAAATARGYSLHIGLNKVDPAQYEGWDGPLAACEFDADDMASLAATVGYEPRTLKTTEATREAVIGEIRAAAARMNPGDIFFLTYSGHGSQVPDFSGDERLERPGGRGRRDALPLRRPGRRRRALRALGRLPGRQPRPRGLRLLPLGLGGEGPADRRPDRHGDHPRPGPARHPARRRRPGRAQAPGLLPRDLRRGDRHLGRAGDPRDGAAGRGQRAADLGLSGQPGGARRPDQRAVHRQAARDLGRRRLPGRLFHLPQRDRRPDAADADPELLRDRPREPVVRRAAAVRHLMATREAP